MTNFRKMIVGANWKIYKKSSHEVKEFVNNLKKELAKYRTDLMDAYILPDPVSLRTLKDELDGYPISYGAQDVFWEDEGSYTGCISPIILRDIGCKYVFIGHSERKKYFKETDIIINKKIHSCYRNGLFPILLIGETLEEKNYNKTNKVLKKQLSMGLDGIPASFLSKMVIVYEPVWAIGKKDSASLDLIEESHIIIRNLLSALYGKDIANLTRILYGGSVNIQNGKGIIRIADVDGLAITRGALDADNFVKFIKITEKEVCKRFKKQNGRGK